MPANMIQNPSLTVNTIGGVEFFNAHADGADVILDGGASYGRVIFELDTPFVAGETYLLDVTITELSGGLNPQVQIVCAEGGPMNLVSGENRFTVRNDMDPNDYGFLVIKGSGSSTTARISAPSLTE
jgi:hypothetical protein